MKTILVNKKIIESQREPEIELNYPSMNDEHNKFQGWNHIQIGLMHVRAADNIRVSYDFDRDGWKIQQAQVFSWEIDDKDCDPLWKEVAFVRAWGSEINNKTIKENKNEN